MIDRMDAAHSIWYPIIQKRESQALDKSFAEVLPLTFSELTFSVSVLLDIPHNHFSQSRWRLHFQILQPQPTLLLSRTPASGWVRSNNFPTATATNHRQASGASHQYQKMAKNLSLKGGK